MENADSDNKKSRLLVFMLVGLVAVATALGVTYYQYSQQADNDIATAVEVVDADQAPEEAATTENKKQPHRKAVDQKQKTAQKSDSAPKSDSGSVLDKLKAGDIEVHGAKNPCTETQRMMKQCSNY